MSVIPRLIYGTAFDLGLPRGNHYDCLLAAWDNGVRHFDTAPVYSRGQSEEIVGRFLQGREGYELTTKVGLPRPRPFVGPAWTFRAARGVKNLLIPANRGSGGESSTQQIKDTRSFDGAAAKVSFEKSLRALKVDRLHWLLYHEATLEEARQDDATDFFTDLRDRQLIRNAGVAGRLPSSFVDETLPRIYEVIQSSADFFRCIDAPASNRQISIYAVLRPTQSLYDKLQQSPRVREQFEEMLQAPLRTLEAVGCLLLQTALLEFPDSKVIFFSSNPKRIGRLVTAARTLSVAIPIRDKVKALAEAPHEAQGSSSDH